MELATERYPIKRRGSEEIALAAGDRIRIQKRLDGETSDVLDYTIPAGKSAVAMVGVLIKEEDAE